MKQTCLALACIFFNLSYGMEQNNPNPIAMRPPTAISMTEDQTPIRQLAGDAQLRNRFSSTTNGLQKHPTHLSTTKFPSKQPSTYQKIALGGITLLSNTVPALADNSSIDHTGCCCALLCCTIVGICVCNHEFRRRSIVR